MWGCIIHVTKTSWGTSPVHSHWIRDSCLSYFWELLFLTARSAGICVAMARVPVGQAAQWGLVVWLTGLLAVLGSGAREKPRPAFRQRGVDFPRGTAQKQLPAAGWVEGGRSEGVELQSANSVRYGHFWYILMWKAKHTHRHSLHPHIFCDMILNLHGFWILWWLAEQGHENTLFWGTSRKTKESLKVSGCT